MFVIILFCALLIVSCSNYSADYRADYKGFKCIDCHKIQIDIGKHLEISCVSCHGGKEPARTKREAHVNLVLSPDYITVESICSSCHRSEAEKFKNSLHYSYKRELETILRGFGINGGLTMLDLSHKEYNLTGKDGIIFDFLRRRCLSCHVFTEGENYPKTRRGLYCLSCHPVHSYAKPKDETCLSCHYSIRIGWDYFGLFPHNWYTDYRSPFVNGKLPERPYGIEAYRLEEDVHRKRGMLCSDCHGKEEVMFGKKGKSCKSCHQKFQNKVFHRREILQKVRCEVCHARYISQDELKICSLHTEVNIESWEGLVVQESSEIEEKLTALLLGKNPELKMKDKFTGRESPGIWLCTLSNRTFNRFYIGRDKRGKICIVRKEMLELRTDNFTVRANLETCKVPHTVGGGDINRALFLIQKINKNVK